jgi:hypothetical protein
MEASPVWKHEYRGKGRCVKYWAHLGCWISPCYGLYSLGVRFEPYEAFISLIFKFFDGATVNCRYRGTPVIVTVQSVSYKTLCSHSEIEVFLIQNTFRAIFQLLFTRCDCLHLFAALVALKAQFLNTFPAHCHFFLLVSASDIAAFFPYGTLDDISVGQKHSVIIVKTYIRRNPIRSWVACVSVPLKLKKSILIGYQLSNKRFLLNP